MVAPISAYNASICHPLIDLLRSGDDEENEVGVGRVDLLNQVRLKQTQAIQQKISLLKNSINQET